MTHPGRHARPCSKARHISDRRPRPETEGRACETSGIHAPDRIRDAAWSGHGPHQFRTPSVPRTQQRSWEIWTDADRHGSTPGVRPASRDAMLIAAQDLRHGFPFPAPDMRHRCSGLTVASVTGPLRQARSRGSLRRSKRLSRGHMRRSHCLDNSGFGGRASVGNPLAPTDTSR